MILLLLLFLKHFIADFPLQAQWIVAGKGLPKGYFFPLFVHVSIHGFLTALILMFFTVKADAFFLAFGEMFFHFIIDRLKAHPSLGGRWKITEKGFWNALGFDQFAHAVCYIVIFYLITGVL